MHRILQLIARYAAWICLAVIVFATLSPISRRPHVASQGLEHILAFAAMTALFCIAYPRHIRLILPAAFAAAVGLELMQLILPDRHARLLDFLRKCVGAMIGAGAGLAVTRLMRRF